MVEIGADVPVELTETVKTVKQATHFNVLEVSFKVPQHMVDVEVCLMDAEGNAIGPAVWYTLNPTRDAEGEEIDKWDAIKKLSLAELMPKIKARLQEIADA